MKRYFSHYFVLALLLGAGVVAFYSIHGNSMAQLLIGVAMCLLYVLWGVFHHAAIGDLRRRIVVEYVLVAAVAALVLYNVLRP